MSEKQEKPTIVFCDFDGTITAFDVRDKIIDSFGDKKERVRMDQLWKEKEIDTKEYVRRLMGSLAIETEKLRKLLHTIPVDKDFKEFYWLCRNKDIKFIVLSDGFDFYIDELIKIYDLPKFEYYSNRLFFEDNKLGFSFPYYNSSCFCKCGTCKRFVIEKLITGEEKIIYIGNGLSDTCAIGLADTVFAKDELYNWCISQGVRCGEFENFNDIINILERRDDAI